MARGSPLDAPARFVVAVGSGKGGVGKSTVSVNLALALAERGAPVGLLDADFYGPNIPLMVGLKRERWQQDWELAARGQRQRKPRIPPFERFGLEIMSAGFIIAEDQPLIIDAQTLVYLMRQLIEEVRWGELEYLIIDLPPGTADTEQALLNLLPLSGAILVVTPQDVAHLDGRKAIQMFRRAGISVLGAVENMSGLICPHCSQPIDVFARVDASRAVWNLDVPNLGSIPLDPQLSETGDRGRPLLVADPYSARASIFRDIAHQIQEALKRGQTLTRGLERSLEGCSGLRP